MSEAADITADELWEQYREYCLPPEMPAEEVKRHQASFLAGISFAVNHLQRMNKTLARERWIKFMWQELHAQMPAVMKRAGLSS